MKLRIQLLLAFFAFGASAFAVSLTSNFQNPSPQYPANAGSWKYTGTFSSAFAKTGTIQYKIHYEFWYSKGQTWLSESTGWLYMPDSGLSFVYQPSSWNGSAKRFVRIEFQGSGKLTIGGQDYTASQLNALFDDEPGVPMVHVIINFRNGSDAPFYVSEYGGPYEAQLRIGAGPLQGGSSVVDFLTPLSEWVQPGDTVAYERNRPLSDFVDPVYDMGVWVLFRPVGGGDFQDGGTGVVISPDMTSVEDQYLEYTVDPWPAVSWQEWAEIEDFMQGNGVDFAKVDVLFDGVLFEQMELVRDNGEWVLSGGYVIPEGFDMGDALYKVSEVRLTSEGVVSDPVPVDFTLGNKEEGGGVSDPITSSVKPMIPGQSALHTLENSGGSQSFVHNFGSGQGGNGTVTGVGGLSEDGGTTGGVFAGSGFPTPDPLPEPETTSEPDDSGNHEANKAREKSKNFFDENFKEPVAVDVGGAAPAGSGSIWIIPIGDRQVDFNPRNQPLLATIAAWLHRILTILATWFLISAIKKDVFAMTLSVAAVQGIKGVDGGMVGGAVSAPTGAVYWVLGLAMLTTFMAAISTFIGVFYPSGVGNLVNHFMSEFASGSPYVVEGVSFLFWMLPIGHFAYCVGNLIVWKLWRVPAFIALSWAFRAMVH